MAASTTPDGIVYPTLSDQGDDLPAVFATLASSVQAAITALRTSTTNALNAHAANQASRMSAGSVTKAGPFAAGSSTSQAITFPAGRFTVAPIVTVTTSRSRINVGVSSVTTTGATLLLENWSTGAEPNSVVLYWQALQMGAAAAG